MNYDYYFLNVKKWVWITNWNTSWAFAKADWALTMTSIVWQRIEIDWSLGKECE